MAITIPVLGTVILLIVLNTILEYLINWVYRKLGDDNLIIIVCHTIKWIILVSILVWMLG
jgi:MFS superfamily sulfate permease-like transporter